MLVKYREKIKDLQKELSQNQSELLESEKCNEELTKFELFSLSSNHYLIESHFIPDKLRYNPRFSQQWEL